MGTEIRGLRDTELEAHSDLVHKSYYEYVQAGERPFLADPQWWLKSAQADPYYEPEQTRVMVIDGQLVASVTNYTRQVYAAGRLAKVSCIGSVCTHPDFRKRGLVKQVLAESAAWMQREEYDWSSLFGKEEVYGGSGWQVLSVLTLSADLRVREDCGAGVTTREAGPADIPDLMRVYEAFSGKLTGPIVRSEAYWRDRIMPGRFGRPGPTYWLLELGGEVIGYCNGGDGVVNEIGWLAEPVEVLGFILRQCKGQPARFACFTSEMLTYLRQASYMPSAKALNEHAGGLTIPESYKGLWRYIGPGKGEFPEITDTQSMLQFLRKGDYVFWPVDSY
ncbi:MAG: GNAT family N-acetyltransferase [Armatimonadia bacterium]